MGYRLAIPESMLPTLIASTRRHHNVIPIGIVNLCFGWTFLGYVAALAWAFSSSTMAE